MLDDCRKLKKWLFQVDDAGGMTKFIDSGAAKLRIEEAATKKQVSCVLWLPYNTCQVSRGLQHRPLPVPRGETSSSLKLFFIGELALTRKYTCSIVCRCSCGCL